MAVWCLIGFVMILYLYSQEANVVFFSMMSTFCRSAAGGLGTPSGRAKRMLPRIARMLTDWAGGQSVSMAGQGVREESHRNSLGHLPRARDVTMPLLEEWLGAADYTSRCWCL
jgi:hypothetical protein